MVLTAAAQAEWVKVFSKDWHREGSR